MNPSDFRRLIGYYQHCFLLEHLQLKDAGSLKFLIFD